jgi:hypothetical protein
MAFAAAAGKAVRGSWHDAESSSRDKRRISLGKLKAIR